MIEDEEKDKDSLSYAVQQAVQSWMMKHCGTDETELSTDEYGLLMSAYVLIEHFENELLYGDDTEGEEE